MTTHQTDWTVADYEAAKHEKVMNKCRAIVDKINNSDHPNFTPEDLALIKDSLFDRIEFERCKVDMVYKCS